MTIRRRLSFDLLRYDSPGGAEEDGDFFIGHGNAKLGIPTRNGLDAAVKSHGRRNRNKGLKSSATDLPLFSVPDNGQIHGNNFAGNAEKDGDFANVNGNAKRGITTWNGSDAGVKSHGRRRRNKGLKRTATDLPPFSALDDGQIHGNSIAVNSVKSPSTVPDFGFLTEAAVKRSEPGFSEQTEAGNGIIQCHAENSVVLLPEDDNSSNTKKDEPVALDNERDHTETDDSLIFREATDMDAHANGVMGIDQVDSADPADRVSVSLLGVQRSAVVNTQSNLEDVSNISNNWGSPPELRQRTVSAILNVKANSCMVENEIAEVQASNGAASPSGGSEQQQQPDKDSNKGKVSFGDPQALMDWERVIAHSSEYPTYVGMSPFQYFFSEIYGGSSLRSTTSVGNDKKRQRVYNTMFHVPWRCELLIDVGFFVCLDSFLSLLTIMPAKILVFTWRCLTVRQFQRPCADELSDIGCLVVLICGVALLQLTDISLIYHFIRGQGTVKLYVVFNVLEIFDKLCQSFGGDVLQVLFNSAEGVATSSKESMAFEIARFILDQMIAVVAFIVHSSVILAQAITLSAAIISHNNALLALLVSNNFAEIKSNVFKRVSKENLHKMAYYDTVERFHIMAYILFVLAQNILEAENAWVWSFAMNALMIWCCEILVDVIKHAFLAKFNEIKPSAYSEFLEILCKQTLNSQSHEVHTTLTFIPLAPACVVIRVLTPIYAAHLPYGPFWWRWLWITLHFSLTYFMLATLKVIVGFGLQMHAKWYVCRCVRRKRHWHAD